MKRPKLTPEDRAIAGLPAEGGKPETPPALEWRDAKVPKDRKEFAEMLAKACARNLELACEPKALTDAIKASVDAFKIIYGEGAQEEEYGSGLRAPGSQNGASPHV